MKLFEETEQTPVEQEQEDYGFSPVYSYTQKINALVKEGKLKKPKYRTLSQEQMATFYTIKDLPEAERKEFRESLKRSSENTFMENLDAAASITAMDILSRHVDNTKMVIGTALVTDDYAPLLPYAAGYYATGKGWSLAEKAASRALAKKIGAKALRKVASTAIGAGAGAVAGGVIGAGVGSAIGLFADTEPAGDDLEAIADEKERKRREAIEELKAKGYDTEDLEYIESLNEKKRNVGLDLIRSAQDSAYHRAMAMPYVDPNSKAQMIVEGFRSAGELAIYGGIGGAIGKATARNWVAKQDRFGRRAAAGERLAQIKRAEGVELGASGLMSLDIMGQGAFATVQKYMEDTGDYDLVHFRNDVKNSILDGFNTHIQRLIEVKYGVPATFNKVAGKRIATKYGEWLNGFAQEFSQGVVNDFFEWTKGNQKAEDIVRNLPNNVIEGLIGAFVQGGIGTAAYDFYHTQTVNAVTDVILGQSTAENPISEQKARAFAESKVRELEDGIASDITNEIVGFVDANDYKGKIFNTILENGKKAVDYQKKAMENTLDGSKFEDYTEEELSQMLVGWAQDQTDRAVIEALDKKIPLAEAALLKGETVDGTYYLEGLDFGKGTRASKAKTREYLMEQVYEGANLEKDVKEMKETVASIKEQQESAFLTPEEDQKVEQLRNTTRQVTKDVVQALSDTGLNAETKTTEGGQVYASEHASSYITVLDDNGNPKEYRISYDDKVTRDSRPNLVANISPNTPIPEIIQLIQSTRNAPLSSDIMQVGKTEDEVKSFLYKKKRPSTKNVEFQAKKGGAYDRDTRSITLGAGANFTTLFHEFAHYWIDKNFKWARSGLASAEWLRQWRAVEKWLGIQPGDKQPSKVASEKFARAYERFLGEEQLPLVLKKAMVDFRDFVQDQYDYDLDEAKSLRDPSTGLPLMLDEATKDWFRKSVYASYLTPEERAIFNARLAKDTQESKEVEPQIKEQQKVQEAAEKSVEITDAAPTGMEIQTSAGVSNSVVLGKKKIGGGEEKQSKGAIAKELGLTYEATSWEAQEQLVNDYLDSVTLDEAIDALDAGTYPDKIDANFLRSGLVERLLDAGREMEAATLIEETAEDFTQAAQTLQAARRINDPFTNAIRMFITAKAIKLAEARYGRKKDAVEKLDAAINALVAKYEKDFMAAETEEEREVIMAAMQDEAVATIGSLDRGRNIEFQTVEERKQMREFRKTQKRRASINAYRSRAKRALKQALGLEPSRTQIRELKKLSAGVAKEIRDYRKAVKENKASAIDPTKILEAQNKLNEYMNEQLPPRVLSNVADAVNSYMMANMLWNPATNVFNIESTWVQMIPHMLATYINYGKGTISWKEKIQLIKQALALQAKTGYNIFSLRDFFDKKTIWAEKYYEPKTKLGKAQAFPLTMLGLADTANKGVVFLQNADSMATKQAKEEGKKNGWNAKQIEERAKELFYQALNTDPRTITRDGLRIREAAVKEGEEATFTQMTRTAELVNKFRKLLNFGKSTGVGTLIMPFTTTISNIAEDTVKNYALGSVKNLVNAPKAIATQFDKSATAEMKKEAWKAIAPETKNVIKNMIGILILLGLGMGGDDEDYVLGYERQTDMDKDIRQNRNAPSGYAVRLGNRWIDLDLFGIGSPWAKAYMIARRDGFTPDGWVKGVASMIDLVPGVGEIQDMYDRYSKVQTWSGDWEALSDLGSDKFAEVIERLIPAEALFNEIGNIEDTSKRVFWNRWYDRALSKIPFARRRLEARTSSATGEEIPQTDVVFNLLTGQRVKQYVPATEADKARYEFALSGKALAYREANSKLKELGKDTPEFKEAVNKVRKSFTKKLEAVADTKEYKDASLEEKRKIANDLHKDALNEIKEEYGLLEKKTKKKLKSK